MWCEKNREMGAGGDHKNETGSNTRDGSSSPRGWKAHRLPVANKIERRKKEKNRVSSLKRVREQGEKPCTSGTL